jgi:hypothetical protein
MWVRPSSCILPATFVPLMSYPKNHMRILMTGTVLVAILSEVCTGFIFRLEFLKKFLKIIKGRFCKFLVIPMEIRGSTSCSIKRKTKKILRDFGL